LSPSVNRGLGPEISRKDIRKYASSGASSKPLLPRCLPFVADKLRGERAVAGIGATGFQCRSSVRWAVIICFKPPRSVPSGRGRRPGISGRSWCRGARSRGGCCGARYGAGTMAGTGSTRSSLNTSPTTSSERLTASLRPWWTRGCGAPSERPMQRRRR